MKLLICLLFFIPTASAMTMSHKLPPMPSHCTTQRTMTFWYKEVAEQNLMEYHSQVVCKKELLKLGASGSVTKLECVH
jgi:hypothetical protein